MATEIVQIQMGVPGPSGFGMSAAQAAALQAIVAYQTTGIVTVTATDTGALLVQKADGTDIFKVDTTNSAVTLTSSASAAFGVSKADGTRVLLVNANSTLVSVQNGGSLLVSSDTGTTENIRLWGSNGHITVGGPAPSVAVGAQAGSGASLGAVSGNDTSGRVTLTTGTGAAAGSLVVVTFASSYATTPSNVVVNALSTNAGGLGHYTTSFSTTGFTIACKTAPTSSAAMTFGWLVIG